MSEAIVVQSGFDALRARLENLPFSAIAWDESLRPLACNRHAARFLKLPQATSFLDTYDELFPVYQPDGSQSTKQLEKLLSLSLSSGLAQAEWCFKNPRTHALLPAALTLTRAQIDQAVVILGYLTVGEIGNEIDDRLRIIMEASPSCIVMWDAHGQIVETNDRMKHLLEAEERGNISENFVKMFPTFRSFNTVASAKVCAIVEHTLKNGGYNGKWDYRNAAGKNFSGQMTAVKVVYRDQPVVAAFISDIREIGADDLEGGDETRALNSESACHLWTADGKLLDCNDVALKLCGDLDKPEHLAHFFDFFFPASMENDETKTLRARDVARRKIAGAIENGYECFVWSRRTQDGAIVPTEVTLKRLRQGDGYLVVSFIRDLALDFAAQTMLRRNGDFAQEVIDKMPLGCLVWKRDLRLLDCNESALRLFGFFGKSELLEKFTPLLGPAAAILNRHLLDVFELGEATIELQCQKTDGSALSLEITSWSCRFQKQDIAITYLRDARQMTMMIDRINSGDNLVRVLFDKMPLGAVMFDENSHILHNNLPLSQLFGLTNREDFADRFMNLLPQKQPNGQDSREAVAEELQRTRDEGYAVREFVFQRADGAPLPVEMTLSRARINDSSVIAGYLRDLREHQAMMTTIRQNEEQLRSARDRAESAAKAKDEFLNKISHELKTPLNGVLGLLNLLRSSTLDDKQKEYIRKVDLSAQSLLRIIEDVLDLTALERSELTMQFLEFSLQDTLDDLYAAKLPLFEARGLQLHFDTNYGKHEIVIGDQLRLKQVLANLLENAMKFTEKGGATLRCAAKSVTAGLATYEFSVSDTGVGLTAEQSADLFKPFKQADDSLTRRYGGVGLGLTICQQLVQMMGGSLVVESRPSCGAVFKFTAVFNVPVGVRSSDSVRLPTTGKRPLLLLVDDNEINQTVAEVALTEMGYKCECAYNGEEAKAKVVEAMGAGKMYDAVLMDIQMPVMDGWEATRQIRKLPNCRVPIIALSANSLDSDREKSFSAGMDDHLTKPFDIDLTVSTIRKYITKYANSRGERVGK